MKKIILTPKVCLIILPGEYEYLEKNTKYVDIVHKMSSTKCIFRQSESTGRRSGRWKNK